MMDRFIDTIEWLAAAFVGIVAVDIFVQRAAALFSSPSRSPTATISANCCWGS